MPLIAAAQSPLLDAALDYAKHSLKVFPCWPIGAPDGKEKSPLISKGFHQATTDIEQIRVWWRRWPQAAIGLPGTSNNLLIIDLDVKGGKNGEADWMALAGPHGWEDLSPGPVSGSPSGGWHLFFALPPGVRIRQGVSRLAPGIDTRTDGYAIVPPTPGYSWVNRNGLQALIPLVPAWLLELLPLIDPADQPTNGTNGASHPPAPLGADAYAPSLGAAEQWLGRMLSQAQIGNRNEHGKDLVLQLRDTAHLSFQDAQQYMRRYWLGVPQPSDNPYTWQACLATLRSIYTGRATPRPPAAQPAPTPAADLPRPAKPISPEELLKFDVDHAGHAHCLQALFPNQFLYSPERGWLSYTGTHWRAEGAQARVHQAAERTLVDRARAAIDLGKHDLLKVLHRSTGNVNGTVEILQNHVNISWADRFNHGADWLNVANGVLNLQDGQLISHLPSQHFSYCLPTAYDPAADRTPWLEFLRGSLGDYEQVLPWLQMAVGYTLTGYTTEDTLFYLYGPPGSGKSTCVLALQTMLGFPLAASLDVTVLTQSRQSNSQNFELASLQPARMVVVAEASENDPLNAAKVKTMTGGDVISCSFKGKDHFSYRPQFKIWMYGNHRVLSDDAALWRRVKVINFPNSHVGHADKGLRDALHSPAILPGILAWAVEGAQAWYAAGSQGLQEPPAVVAATTYQRNEADMLQHYLDECVLTSPKYEIRARALLESYKSWCDTNNMRPKTGVTLARLLRERGFESKRRDYGNVWTGLRLRD